MNTARIACQSISGGMDSTCLALHHLAAGRELHLLSFDYGQRHSLELERLDKNLALFEKHRLPFTHRRVNVPFGEFATSTLTNKEADTIPRGHYEDENMRKTVVPNRNAIFSSILYSLALSVATERKEDALFSLGVHSGDHEVYPDCRLLFFEKLTEAFAVGNWGSELIHLSVPYISMNKTGILKDATQSCGKLGLDFDEVLGNTNTSYSPTEDGLADGTTGSDVERILAFRDIGRRDPIPYVGGWDHVLSNAIQLEESHSK